jgi:hypothetical protein
VSRARLPEADATGAALARPVSSLAGRFATVGAAMPGAGAPGKVPPENAPLAERPPPEKLLPEKPPPERLADEIPRAAGGGVEFRAATSAGDSNPVCVTVREWASGAAFGRDGVFPRPLREGGRGAERGPAWLLPSAFSPRAARLARSRPASSEGEGGELVLGAVTPDAPWLDAPWPEPPMAGAAM